MYFLLLVATCGSCCRVAVDDLHLFSGIGIRRVSSWTVLACLRFPLPPRGGFFVGPPRFRCGETISGLCATAVACLRAVAAAAPHEHTLEGTRRTLEPQKLNPILILFVVPPRLQYYDSCMYTCGGWVFLFSCRLFLSSLASMESIALMHH